MFQLVCDLCFFLDSPGSQGGAGVSEPFLHHDHEVQVFGGTVLYSDLDDAPIQRGRLIIPFDIIPPDNINNDIGPFAIRKFPGLLDGTCVW